MGRGSAAGAIVAYAMDITALDPLSNGLLFERFLSPERVEMPDIDVDFEQGRREEVINHIKDVYGEDHVSQVITFGTLQAKNAVRDAARVLDYPYSTGDRICKMIGDELGITIDKALATNPDLKKAYETEEDVKAVIDAALSIEGHVRGEGVHACATIICRDPMADHVPMKRDTKGGGIITQYDGHYTPELGLLKMDFLGLRTLDVLTMACCNIEQRFGTKVIPEDIPIDDEELAKAEPKRQFTIGIVDDVTNLSLPESKSANTAAEGTIECKFWGLGGDGTVGANKNSIKIIGDHTDKYVQAYFQYDSKKTGGVTISHLRFGDKPIKSPYYINKADFVACHVPSYITKSFPIVRDVKPGGTFLINCQWSFEELEHHLDAASKRYIAKNNIQLYTINAIDLAIEIGMGKRTNTILQSAFFSLAKIMPEAEAIQYMKDAATHSYLKKGQDIVDMNHKAIDLGATAYKKVEVPASWATAEDGKKESVLTGPEKLVKMVESILDPVDRMDGDSLPVSAFVKHVDGQFELGAAAYEKRGVAVSVPTWDSTKCIQCNNCAYVCPHATIRPFALTEEEAKNAPAAAKIVDVKAGKGKGVYKYTMAISPLDCMGCAVCVGQCPVDALTMVDQEQEAAQQEVFNYCVSQVSEKKDMQDNTVKGSQFRQPMLEFSGSCAGCAETSYARLITQLFGDRMYISNATGCSSIWGGPAATSPYCTNKEGHGPAWANSLFEDNAEHGLGMYLGQQATRSRLADLTRELIAKDWAVPALKEAGQKWLDTMEDSAANGEATKAYIAALESSICTVDELLANPKAEIHAFGEELKAKGETLCQCDACKLAAEILADKEFLSKKSMWIFGGDGWAYDIGFGGLDHVLASGNDVNVFVFDTEVYSNTGGQASKASNIGQVAQFAAAGKEIKKKSLAEIAMSYGYIYVAQVAMGANPAQTLKAIQEAEAYPGPSLIIGYAPCEMHSIKGGMMNCQKEMKKAVECGYWNLFRFNPAAEGAKFTLDSKEPAGGYQEFLMNEARYSRLTREFPDRAGELFQRNEKNAMERYQHLLKLKSMYEG